jgi:type II secretory pathway pseudopilin PulG
MKNTAKKRERCNGGFTLIEALFAAMLLGLVVAALAAASGAFTMANGYGMDLSTAEFLIEEMREYTAMQSFDGLLADPDYNTGIPISPPRNTNDEPIDGFDQFGQQVDVVRVQEGNFEPPGLSDSPFVRVTVQVTKGGQPISSTSWIRAQLEE